jgi:hypothetical protein
MEQSTLVNSKIGLEVNLLYFTLLYFTLLYLYLYNYSICNKSFDNVSKFKYPQEQHQR